MVEITRESKTFYNGEKDKNVSKYCLRYTNPSFSIFKKELSDDEKYLLREALSLLGQFDGLPNLDGMDSLRTGLAVKEAEKQIVSFTKNPIEDTNIFGLLFTAIANKQVLEIEYFTFSAPNSKYTCRLHPYLLKEYNRRWYLIGAACDDQKILCFALDRISSVNMLGTSDYVEYEGDIYERFEDIIGVTLYENEPLHHIVFWVSPHSVDYVDTKPIHESQRNYKGEKEEEFRKQYPQLNGGAFFSIDCKKNYELIRELCSFGKDLIVLSPDAIRGDICKRIQDMSEAYQRFD